MQQGQCGVYSQPYILGSMQGHHSMLTSLGTRVAGLGAHTAESYLGLVLLSNNKAMPGQCHVLLGVTAAAPMPSARGPEDTDPSLLSRGCSPSQSTASFSCLFPHSLSADKVQPASAAPSSCQLGAGLKGGIISKQEVSPTPILAFCFYFGDQSFQTFALLTVALSPRTIRREIALFSSCCIEQLRILA